MPNNRFPVTAEHPVGRNVAEDAGWVSSAPVAAGNVSIGYVENGLQVLKTRSGRTLLTVRAKAHDVFTRVPVLSAEQIMFVDLDERGSPPPHGRTAVTYDRDRVPTIINSVALCDRQTPEER